MSERRFMIGETIRLINSTSKAASCGATAIVQKYDREYVWVKWCRDGFDRGQSDGNYSPFDFERIEDEMNRMEGKKMSEEQIEVGDMVMRINSDAITMKVGETGIVKSINNSEIKIVDKGVYDLINFRLVQKAKGKVLKIKVVHPQFLAIIKSCNNLRLVQDKKTLSEMKENAKIYKLIPLYELEEKREFVKKKME